MPKKKAGKHLQFYMDCMNDGKVMPVKFNTPSFGGLCSMAEAGFISYKLFKLFSDGMSEYHYWAAGDDNPYETKFHFTPLRQTIVLFMAFLNNEL